MATNHTPGSVGLLNDLVDAAGQNQTLIQRKANTVTVTIGSILSALAATGTYWIESGSDAGVAAPPWLPLVVFLVGQIITIIATSQTRNGITESVKDRLGVELTRLIDTHHEHTVEQVGTNDDVLDLRETAKRLAGE